MLILLLDMEGQQMALKGEILDSRGRVQFKVNGEFGYFLAGVIVRLEGSRK